MAARRTAEGSAAEAPKAKAAAGEAYTVMRASILDGELAPGERINIDALARRLQVSPTPVREALQRLEGDNLVVYSPGRGYSTTPLLEPSELRSLFEFRLLVEPWAARSAAVDRLSNPGRILQRELDTLEERIAHGGDIRQHLVAHDARFHDLILAAAENPVVRQAYAQTHCHLHTFRLYPADVEGDITLAEHREIAAAIGDCDAAGAEEAMGRHILKSFDRFAQAFEGPAALGPLQAPAMPRPRLIP